MNYYRELFSWPERVLLRGASAIRQKDRFFDAYERRATPVPSIDSFRNRHAGSRCFILGGGPSLRKLEPGPLKSEFTFGVNGCFLIYDWLGFQPTYYAVEDSLVYEDRAAEIVSRVTESQCFFPVQFRRPGFNAPHFNFYRAVYDLDERPGWPRFSTDAARLMWIGGTVTYVCLQLAYYMGFDEVYLVGMDHSYTKPSHVTTDGPEWTSQGPDPNHFHEDYFGAGKRWHDPRTDRMETAYRAADTAFRRAGRRVCNATAGGALEVFDRVRYDDLF